MLATGGAYDREVALPLSYNTLAEFRKRCGYDLLDNLASLYWDVGDFRKVRFDYWQTMHDLWKENFMRPMFQWCDRNNLQFTGHWMEHRWPDPWITPADASLYAFEHVPGIDMLEGANLRTQRQRSAHALHHQAGGQRVASTGPARLLRGLRRGRLGQHLRTLQALRRLADGARRQLHEPAPFALTTDSRRAQTRPSAELQRRVAVVAVLQAARRSSGARVLPFQPQRAAQSRALLEQTTSGFLLARRGAATPELVKMRSNNAELNQFLADHQVDFDLGDEYMLEWFGKADGRKLTIGRAGYDLVLWPPDMQNVRSQTIPLLEKYLAAGGEIVALSAPAAFVDGRPSDTVKQLQQRYAKQWRSADGLPAALSMIHQRLAPRVEFASELPSGIGLSERFLANGDRVLFLANTGLKAVSTRATVEGGSAENWDTESGAVAPLAFTSQASGRISFDVRLEPAGSTLLLVKKASAKPAVASKVEFAPLSAGPWRVQVDAPNVLVLDYCDLKIGNEMLPGLNTWRANWTIWQRHGFERPAWDNAVQFKTRVFDRNHFAKDSGFEATFRFDVEDVAAIPGLQLALELPELYHVTVNGASVKRAGGRALAGSAFAQRFHREAGQGG